MKPFQIIIAGIFGFFLLIAVLVFSGVIPSGDKGEIQGASGTVVLWGTIKSEKVIPLFENFR